MALLRLPRLTRNPLPPPARRAASLLNTVRLMRLTCEHMAERREQDERAWHAAKRHDHHPAPAAYEQHQLLHTALRLAHALWPAALPTLGALGAEAFGRAVLALGQRTLDAT